jgi:hypothetical protein
MVLETHLDPRQIGNANAGKPASSAAFLQIRLLHPDHLSAPISGIGILHGRLEIFAINESQRPVTRLSHPSFGGHVNAPTAAMLY